MGRRPYTTLARFFSDSERTVKIRWYRAKIEDGTLGVPTRFCSLDWMSEPWTHEGVGEVYGEDRKFNRAKPLGPVPGHHVCGTPDQFENGEPLDPSKPPMLYWPSGLPKCCDPGRREARVTVGISIRRPYWSRIRVGIVIRSHTLRSDPYRSASRVVVSIRSHTLRSDPYRSRLGVGIAIMSHIVRSDPYRSRLGVGIAIRSHYVPSIESPPSGYYEQHVGGPFFFIAEYTGDHAFYLYGAGGKGGDSTDGGGMDLGGGGGGGGACVFAVLSLTAGVTYNGRVGGGGQSTSPDGGNTLFKLVSVVLVKAMGGKAGIDISHGAGGDATLCIGDLKWSGGDGDDSGPLIPGGGGGSSACAKLDPPPPGTGTNGDGSVGGIPPYPDGGPGGDGGDVGANGVGGGFSGGGGGGAGAGVGARGGDGWDGRILIVWPPP